MTNIKEKYTERLLQAFPSELKNDVLKVIDILPFYENNLRLADGNIHFIDDFIHESTYAVNLNSETLIIPYRLYFNEPSADKETSLSKKQQAILNCIYLRHHNGYVRQKRLERLHDNFNYFIIPFTLQLLGEYVKEILEVLDKQINDNTTDKYLSFISENPLFWRRTQKRVVSYWNTYYRYSHKKLKDYVGIRIISKLKKVPA